MAGSRIYTVTQLNQEIKNLLEANPSFFNLFVRGEISNYKAHPSGHHYMTIKDENAAIAAVLFRSDAAKLRFRLANGMKVIARGRISSFPKSGQVQLYLADLIPDGAGSLHLQFEQRKQKLFEEGLFAQEHKKPLPPYPERIALITSPSGAAVHDMLRILNRRWPVAEIFIFPAAVQGDSAPAELAAALRAANRHGQADLILLGRGGGSIEDLWAFNDEALAREIFRSKIPVISAVGHEPDVTIADFVADLRAPTPSGAAELSTPNRSETAYQLHLLEKRLRAQYTHRMEHHRAFVHAVTQRLNAQKPLRFLAGRRKDAADLQSRLTRAIASVCNERSLAADWTEQQLQRAAVRRLENTRTALARSTALLDAFSPLKILSRGYAVALDEAGSAVTDAGRLSENDRLTLCFAKGSAVCRVEDTIQSEEQSWQPEKN